MRRRDPLSPEAVRELEAIDLSLAGETVDYDLREIDDLVRDVRASAPEMSPALSARLERELEAGFAAPAAAGKQRRGLPSLRVLVPALGTLVAALVALVVVIGRGTDTVKPHHNSAAVPAEKAAPAEDLAIPKAARSSSGAASSQAATPTPQPDLAPTARTRKVQRSVTLVLSTAADKVESTADEVIQTVDRLRGIVATSSISGGDEDNSEATFDLRIPTSKLDAALGALSKLGHVAERRQDLQDITAAFTSTGDRLADVRAERRGLLKALGNASTQAQIESLRSRLRLVGGQIASDKAQLSTLQRRASLSTVSVTVRGDGTPKAGGGWSIGDAGGDALHALEVIAGIALVAGAIGLPLALLGAAILFGSRRHRGRRRENALDAA